MQRGILQQMAALRYTGRARVPAMGTRAPGAVRFYSEATERGDSRNASSNIEAQWPNGTVSGDLFQAMTNNVITSKSSKPPLVTVKSSHSGFQLPVNLLPESAIPENFQKPVGTQKPSEASNAKWPPKSHLSAGKWPLSSLPNGVIRRPRFAHEFFFDYQGALDRVGKCLKFGCKEEDLELAAFIAKNLAGGWHTGAASAMAAFLVEGALVTKVNPMTMSLTRVGVQPVNQLFVNVVGDGNFWLDHHEVNVQKPNLRKARDGDKVVTFTSFRVWDTPNSEYGYAFAFATHMFYQGTRDYIGTVQVLSRLMGAMSGEAERIKGKFRNLREQQKDKVKMGRKWCYLLEKDLRRLEEKTWNSLDAVEDLGSAARAEPAVSETEGSPGSLVVG